MQTINRIIPFVALLIMAGTSRLAAQIGTVSIFTSLGREFVLASDASGPEWGGGTILDAGFDYAFAPGFSAGAVLQRTTLEIVNDNVCRCRVGSTYTSTALGPRLRYSLQRTGTVSLYSAANLQMSLVRVANTGLDPITTTNLAGELAVGADYRLSPVFSLAAEAGYAFFDVGIGTVHTLPVRLRASYRP